MTLSINGKTYEAGELIAYVSKLEKENAQWKQRNETLKDALEHARKLYGDELEKAYKENAELKKKNLDTQDAVTMQMYTNKANKEIADRQLTEAKNILKYVLNSFVGDLPRSLGFFDEEELKAIAKAEQFLSEVEERK